MAAALTRLHLALGPRLGHFAPADALHPRPVCLSGGVGIWIALSLVVLVLGEPGRVNSLLLGCSLVMAALGLWDDLTPLPPGRKLAFQVVIATAGAALGLRFEMPELGGLALPLSVLWLVGMANAFNLIDNMDGLAAGVAAIAAGFLALHALRDGKNELALVAGAFAGAYAGFLLLNFRPARIFMGDCGSLAAGFFLGGLGIAGTWRGASNLLLVVATAGLVLAVPIFNLVFVVVGRALSGVPLFHGRADHINYRLVAHGLSERQAVLAVYALATACGGLAVWYTRVDSFALVALLSGTTVAFLYLAVFLYEASVLRFYRDFQVEHRAGGAMPGLRRWSRHGWRLLQLVADLLLVSAGYYLAYAIRFDGAIPAGQQHNFLLSLPLVILLKLGAFTVFRLYGNHWRYVAVADLVRIGVAVAASAGLLAATAGLPWPAPLSRSVLVIDAILTALLVGASRAVLRLLWEVVVASRAAEGGVRTVIVGANDRGELALRLARQDDGLALNVVGFVDDDPGRTAVRIHGLDVLGPTSELPAICLRRRVRLAIVALPSAPAARIEEVARLCRRAGVACKVLSLRLDEPPVAVSHPA
ncbi:MAG TPA: hypothetical protein VNO23_18930 [Candidatus Binatia bacterium]|nr:hypothetical protein [Candidatus Binatia bacterium]